MVSNGKLFLSKPDAKSRPRESPKMNQNRNDSIFAENSIAEVVQESVHDNVEILLKNLEESSEKAVRDIQSPDHHISSITTSTSSLAIDDGSPSQQPLMSQTFIEDNSENLQENQPELLIVNSQENEKPSAEEGNGNNYFPIFTKTSSSKKIVE
jgi:hypothetical protein